MTTKKDFIELGKWQLNAFKQRDEYRQALEEIREMLTECSTNANFLNNCSKSCKFYKNCNGELSVIQNKIDEVLNDRD